jgi:hypothetical protein
MKQVNGVLKAAVLASGAALEEHLYEPERML